MRPIRHFQICDSTNDEAAKWAQEGAPHGAVVRADAQSRGRGRLGRAWNSPADCGLYFSVLARPQKLALEHAARLTIVAALACARGIEEIIGRKMNVKWPNDVVLNERKIGGILCEAHAKENEIDFAIIGIGINVNFQRDDLPPNVKIPASSLLLETRRRWELDDVLYAVGNQFDTLFDQLQSGAWNALREEFAARDILQNRRVRVETPGEIYEGVSDGLDEDGILRVRCQDETRKVIAGDVTLIVESTPE